MQTVAEIGSIGIPILLAILAVVVALYEPKTRKAKAGWIAGFGILGLLGVWPSVWLSDSADKVNAQAKLQRDEIQNGIKNLASQMKVNFQSPNQVLATAANRFKLLDAKVKEQQAEIESLRVAASWRDIKQVRAKALVRDLRKAGPHTVDVVSIMGDTESFNYAKKWAAILRDAGWIVGHGGIEQAEFNRPMTGLIISANVPPVPETAEVLGRVLKAHHFSVAGNRDTHLPKGAVELVVGSKSKAKL